MVDLTQPNKKKYRSKTARPKTARKPTRNPKTTKKSTRKTTRKSTKKRSSSKAKPAGPKGRRKVTLQIDKTYGWEPWHNISNQTLSNYAPRSNRYVHHLPVGFYDGNDDEDTVSEYDISSESDNDYPDESESSVSESLDYESSYESSCESSVEDQYSQWGRQQACAPSG